MFLHFSQVKAKSKRIVFAALVLVLLTAFLAGCDTDPADDTNYEGELPAGLLGSWIYPSIDPLETYTITGTTFQYVYDDGDSFNYFDFTAEICFVSNYSDTSGVIIIKYTDHAYFDYLGDFLYSAIYYRDLSGSTVRMANVFDLINLTSADTETEEEAIAKFTKGNVGKYINWTNVQAQTKVTS